MIENMQLAMGQNVTEHSRKTLFVCLFCGGAKTCDRLKSVGGNALCLSWGQNGEKPRLSKIIPILENLLLKSDALTNAVVVCSEHVADNRTSIKTIFIYSYLVTQWAVYPNDGKLKDHSYIYIFNILNKYNVFKEMNIEKTVFIFLVKIKIKMEF